MWLHRCPLCISTGASVSVSQSAAAWVASDERDAGDGPQLAAAALPHTPRVQSPAAWTRVMYALRDSQQRCGLFVSSVRETSTATASEAQAYSDGDGGWLEEGLGGLGFLRRPIPQCWHTGAPPKYPSTPRGSTAAGSELAVSFPLALLMYAAIDASMRRRDRLRAALFAFCDDIAHLDF